MKSTLVWLNCANFTIYRNADSTDTKLMRCKQIQMSKLPLNNFTQTQ